MTILKAILFVCPLILFSCIDHVTDSKQFDSDTMKVLQAALKRGTSDEFMPEVFPLQRKYRFGDSILLTSEVLPLDLLPSTVDNQKFKILPQQLICKMINADSSMADLPNYLSVKRFEKRDTGYYVQVCSLSCFLFGGGGTLGLYFKKVGDSLIIVHQSATSIN